jgi:hypothetical protein
VGGVDASVNDVGTSALASAAVIGVGGLARGLLGDTSETPGSTGLGSVSVDGDNGILLNIIDLKNPECQVSSYIKGFIIRCEENSRWGRPGG